MQIKHMYEYYSAGNNVWQADESKLRTVEQLECILDLIYELEEVENDNCGLELIYDENDNLIGSIKPDDYDKRIQEQDNQIKKLYEEIYSLIGKNIRCWWD